LPIALRPALVGSVADVKRQHSKLIGHVHLDDDDDALIVVKRLSRQL
jgi:hypothetical protein